jgi:uncharacterized pyridoxamine 5'-phosphate oxidase family protein
VYFFTPLLVRPLNKKSAEPVQITKIKEEGMTVTEKIVGFLQDSRVFYIATIDGGSPQVRPFGAALDIDGRPAICTGAWKNVAKQIAKNPEVAISAMRADGKYIRISGRLADVSTDENRKKFFDYMPDLAGLYRGKEHELLVLSFARATATISDMAGNSETIILE